MITRKSTRLNAVVFFLATLSAPVLLGQSANLGRPGTLNYVEGSASIGGRPLTARSIGALELEPGQTLETTQGKVELLLTPGVFLRLDDNSAVTMVSPNLTDTRLELIHGRAAVEADEILKQNNIQIITGTGATRLLKEGFYEFDRDAGTVRVFSGKAAVFGRSGDQARPIEVKGNHQLTLASAEPLKPVGFETKNTQDDLYNWSSLRSQYLAGANASLATQYAGYSGFAPGWYWDNALWGYTWLPGDGMFWNPFGWGFYSPWWIYGGGPIFRGRVGYYGGYHGYVGHVNYAGASGFHGGAMGAGGFHGGGGGRR
jgi:hypothetical protein